MDVSCTYDACACVPLRPCKGAYRTRWRRAACAMLLGGWCWLLRICAGLDLLLELRLSHLIVGCCTFSACCCTETNHTRGTADRRKTTDYIVRAQPLNNGVSSAGNTGPQISALLGNGASDGGALHLALGVDNDTSIVLKVDVGTLLSPPWLALADDHSRGDCNKIQSIAGHRGKASQQQPLSSTWERCFCGLAVHGNTSQVLFASK